MIKKTGVLIIALLFLMPLIMALDTQVTVKSSENRLLTIRFLDPDGKGTLENGGFLDQSTDSEGKVLVTYSSNTENIVDVSVMIRDSAGTLMKFQDGSPVRLFEDLKTGWIYEIDLTQANSAAVQLGKVGGETNETTAEEIIEETTEESEEVIETPEPEQTKETEEISQETANGITGKAISIDLIPRSVFYIVVVVIIMLVFIYFFVIKKSVKPKPSSVKFREKLTDEEEEELRDAEERIKRAEEEINNIKNKEKNLRQAQEEFEKAKAKLQSLKGGESRNNAY